MPSTPAADCWFTRSGAHALLQAEQGGCNDHRWGGALPDGLHVGEEGVKGDQVIACVLELACHYPHAPGRIIVLPHSLGAQNMMV